MLPDGGQHSAERTTCRVCRRANNTERGSVQGSAGGSTVGSQTLDVASLQSWTRDRAQLGARTS